MSLTHDYHEVNPLGCRAADAPQPVRLVLSHRKGFNLQALSLATNGLPAVVVTRRSKWGSPFRLKLETREVAIAKFRALLAVSPQWVADAKRELAGKNLACFCPLDKACHAELWLEIANQPQARLKAQDRRLERREWLMGFPIDHTACDASEIRLYRRSCKSLPAPSTSK